MTTILMPDSVPSICIKNNFFYPVGEWTDDDKQRYREWWARLPEDHPSKGDPEPWENVGDR